VNEYPVGLSQVSIKIGLCMATVRVVQISEYMTDPYLQCVSRALTSCYSSCNIATQYIALDRSSVLQG
jgi:hypothetical protein